MEKKKGIEKRERKKDRSKCQRSEQERYDGEMKRKCIITVT